MAWWEWIPVVSTIGHGMADPPGRKVSDYQDCKCTAEECADPYTAKLRCEKCIAVKLSGYIADWMGSSIGSDGIEALAGGVATTIGLKSILKQGVAKGAAALTGVGLLVLADGIADLTIQITKMFQMKDAAAKAKLKYCVCPPPPDEEPSKSGGDEEKEVAGEKTYEEDS